LIGLTLLLIITGAAFRLIGERTNVEPDFEATREASLTDCGDLYPAGSEAYRACIEGQ